MSKSYLLGESKLWILGGCRPAHKHDERIDTWKPLIHNNPQQVRRATGLRRGRLAYEIGINVLERPDHELAKISLEHGRGLVAGDKGVDGSGDRLGHAVATAELNACRNRTLRKL